MVWMNPWYTLLLFAGLLPYIIMGLFFQRRSTMYFCLSKAYQAKYRKRLGANLGLFLMPFLFLPVLPGFEFAIVLFSSWIICAVLGTTWCRLIKLRKIEAGFAYLGGIPEEVQEKIIKMDVGRSVPVSFA